MTVKKDILSLLNAFAKPRGDSTIKSAKVNVITRTISIQPAISAFSDHIVFSFTTDQLKQHGFNPVFNLANNAGWIFSRAIRLGCPVRRAISYGPLHHHNGVVFGKGLLGAHKLESKFAKWPRIIISQGAAEKLGSHPFLYPDCDGFTSLDYMQAAYDLEVIAGQPLPARAQAKRDWIAEISRLSKDQIDALTKTQNLAGLQIRRWFLTRFERRFVPKTDGLLPMEQPQPSSNSSDSNSKKSFHIEFRDGSEAACGRGDIAAPQKRQVP